MESWQELRLTRAKAEPIYVTSVECTDDSFVFTVQGVSDEYMVEILEDIAMWPPRCSCLDASWRPGILCKHCILCLRLMGVKESCLEDCYWEPEQHELYEYLCYAPDCVGCSISQQTANGKNKSENKFPDSDARAR